MERVANAVLHAEVSDRGTRLIGTLLQISLQLIVQHLYLCEEGAILTKLRYALSP